MKIKTSELTGAALDWAVASYADKHVTIGDICWGNYSPSTDWAQGGPIIEMHISRLEDLSDDGWEACGFGFVAYGPTPLIAAMRCFVASKLGDEVEIPDELAS
jgi:Protein of unknown function (DUF2591)